MLRGGRRLRDLMDAKGLENKDLSGPTGKSTATVTQWKNGHEIHTEDIVVICPILGCSTDFLLLGYDTSNTTITEAQRLIESLDQDQYQTILQLIRLLSD